MAVDGRHPPPDLSDETTVRAMDFFELLRRLETDTHRFGRGGGPAREPARLGQSIRLAFAASDVVSVNHDQPQGEPPRVAANVIGLFGPEGPMPLHITRWMLERASNRWFSGEDGNATADTAFLDFSNALQHRMIAFYWRSWADMRPEVQIAHGTGGLVAAMVRALAGIGLTDPGVSGAARASAKLRHSTSLFMRVRSPGRLAEYLASAIRQRVTIREFVGVWTDIPEHLQSRLGVAGSSLGGDAIVGSRFFERETRAAVVIGPLSLEDYTAFLDDPARRDELAHALKFAMGHGMDFDIILALASDEIPPARLGDVRLGEIAWLGRPEAEAAEDKVLRRFGAEPADATGAAA